MKIKSFRVSKFRNIQDSGEITLENLTCVVGKNQSGKTALLKALHKFNPYQPEPYDIRREWPRGERRQRNPKHEVCSVRFQLDQEEKNKLSELTNQSVTAERVLITKDYEGNFEILFPEQPDLLPDKLHPNDIDEVCKSLPEPDGQVGSEFVSVAQACLEEVRRLVREGRFSDLSSLGGFHRETLQAAFTSGNPEPQHQLETQYFKQYSSFLKGLETEILEKPTMKNKAHDYIVSQIPTFIYMDDYREFQGTALLDQLATRHTQHSLTPEDETVLMILKLSGLDLDELVRQGQSNDLQVIRERQYDLEDAARTLTKDVAGRWGQTPYAIQFRADGQKFFTEIEEKDKDIGMIPLEEQAKGFRWFFSFDLRFMHDSEGTFEGCVLLLDEPGLHLHPGGQKDLLERLDAYAEKNVLFYTTHLPFLIDLREPSRIRVINQTDNGAVVSDDLGTSGPDEKMTLQAALGMTMSQSYLVAQRNLVVEGVDDYMIIAGLANLFERSDHPILPDDIQITAAGGASEAVYMATFMVGQELEVVALFDSDNEGRTQEERLRKKWLTRYKNAKSDTLLLGDAVGLSHEEDFAIEDLFPENYYRDKLQESHKQKMQDANIKELVLPKTKELLANRASKACKDAGIIFNKGSVAKLIKKDLAKMMNVDQLAKLDQTTKNRTEEFLKKISDKFAQ